VYLTTTKNVLSYILYPKKNKHGDHVHKSWKNHTTLNGQSIIGVKIPFGTFRKILELREDATENLKEQPTEEELALESAPITTLIRRWMSQHKKYYGVAFTPEEVAAIFLNSEGCEGREELLKYGMETITAAIKLCKASN
jgi:hypothetical protein